MEPMTHRFTLELRKLERDRHDACSACGRCFKEGETAHSGYSAVGDPLYVGDCCSLQVYETAARYMWSTRPYETPPDSAFLWRYMDLSKFIGLLRDRSLYFSRLDHLGDPWEGAKGGRKNKQAWDNHYLRFFQEAIRHPPEGYVCGKTDEQIEAEANRLLRQLDLSGSDEQRTNFVSCWHETESEALWRLYCPPTTAGVAIKTTFGDLKAAFDQDLSIKLGRVKYLDFRSQFAGLNEAVFRKRRSLQHEQEVRAVIRTRPEREALGLARPVDLSALVKEVVTSPFAPAWFGAIVGDLLLRYDLPVPIRTSELLSEPFF